MRRRHYQQMTLVLLRYSQPKSICNSVIRSQGNRLGSIKDRTFQASKENPMPDSPVKEISFGTALTISLNNYYDLLKNQVGGLATEEYLQLKLVADAVDISEEKYPWYSYYNLLQRSDQAIEPTPVAGVVMTGASELAAIYERFLRQLRGYVVKKNLSPEDQKALAALDIDEDAVKVKCDEWYMADRARWLMIAAAMGYQVGDMNAYIQWSSNSGHLRDIQLGMRKIRDFEFAKKSILDKQYPEPTDREVVDAEFDFENPSMRLRYPMNPDSMYPEGGKNFNLTYLASLPLGSTALFADRRAIAWDKSLSFIQTAAAGAFGTEFSHSTSDSNSIQTDWSASASASYAFIKVEASASESTQIQSDFSHGTTINASAAAAFKLGISYPQWFRPSLFEHKRVVENIHDFEEFFGHQGSLLYFPTHLILVRGFKVEFTSTQNWTFDYKHRFSASSGGGFNVFGFGFGGSGSYSNETKEHSVDVTGTKLTISDDSKTVRFVGYAVKKNTVFAKQIPDSLLTAMGKETMDLM
jgi:hypothetical protein